MAKQVFEKQSRDDRGPLEQTRIIGAVQTRTGHLLFDFSVDVSLCFGELVCWRSDVWQALLFFGIVLGGFGRVCVCVSIQALNCVFPFGFPLSQPKKALKKREKTSTRVFCSPKRRGSRESSGDAADDGGGAEEVGGGHG